MEATYEFEVRDMPVTVVMDSSGTSVHQTGPREWQGRGRWSTSWPCRAAAMASSNPCCGASSRRWLPKPRAQAQRAAGDPAATPAETVDEILWLGRPLVVARNPERAAEQAAQRQGRIAELQARAQALSDKLDAQDEGQRSRGRALSDSGAQARFFHEVAQAHLATIVKVDEIDDEALARAELMDGKLLLVTNVTAMKPAEVVARYKSLADIERGFRVLESEIEIAPVYHRLPERIRAHAGICFMALILHRVMRQRLKLAGHCRPYLISRQHFRYT